MTSKTSQAVEAFKQGDFKKALCLVRSFRVGVSPEERKTLSLGYEAMVHPGFYRQVGKNPDQMLSDAKKAFEALFLQKA